MTLMISLISMDSLRCFRRVKKITVRTVHMPITEPTTGPAIQVGLRGAGADDCVGLVVLAVCCAATAAETEARDADSVVC